jgi:hypothetical protein
MFTKAFKQLKRSEAALDILFIQEKGCGEFAAPFFLRFFFRKSEKSDIRF